MKPSFNRLSRLSQITLAAATITSAQATLYTWTGAAGGNWSDSAKWDTNGIPVNDGTADVAFNPTGAPNITETINSAWGASGSGSINSLRFLGGTNNLSGTTGQTLTLGAGGLINTSTKTVTFNNNLSLDLGATQTWTLTNHVNFNGQLKLKDNVQTTFATAVASQGLSLGSGGSLTLNNGSVAIMDGIGTLAFNGGTTTTVGTGAFKFNRGVINLNAQDQYGRLGTNALTVLNNFTTRIDFTGAKSGTFATPVTFSGNQTNEFTIQFGPSSNAFDITGAQTAVAVTGQWTGAVNGGSVSNSSGINIHLGNVWDDRQRFVFQGNNSGLTSTANAASATAAIKLRTGYLVVDHANALGSGNSLSIGLGVFNSDTSHVQSGVLATNGNHVSGGIYARTNQNATPRTEVSVLGLSGTGSVNFTGNIYLQLEGTATRVQTLKLTAPTSGTANFSGIIANVASGANAVPVVVLGGGTVSLSGNNTYTGTTSVRGGSLLLGHANALGGGSSTVSLGDTVVAPAGGDVVVATKADFSNATGGNLPAGVTASWAGGVFTFSGAVNTFDGVTLNNGDRILVKDRVSAAQQTGVYVRTSATTWTRATDLDNVSEYVQGLRIHVTGGSNAGNNYYMPTALVAGTTLDGTGTNAKFGFNEDAASNTDVAILTDAALTINRNIAVTDNLSSGKSILGGNSAHASVFSGNITLARGLTVTAASGGSVDFSGTLTGASGVTKEGLGTVAFSSAKGYTGPTTIKAGTLKLTGGGSLASNSIVIGDTGSSGAILDATTVTGSDFTVGSTQTVIGIGTLDATGKNVSVAGSIAPGNSAGLLSVSTTSLQFGATSALSLELTKGVTPAAGSNYDQLGLTGGITINTSAALNLTALGSGSWTLNDIFFLINNDGADAISGTFSGYAEGGTFTFDSQKFKITYLADYDTTSFTGGNDLALQVIPEPAAAGLLGSLGMLALLRRRRG
ncbi:MAG: autotransporter-associated beta strand repeat-containing protein [Luteolibacter sp.]|jgi:autotransporter-associated beta strand protein|nr:autotransporter-associated beta strand repeat-containing protein [Luteolibacter sp.]